MFVSFGPMLELGGARTGHHLFGCPGFGQWLEASDNFGTLLGKHLAECRTHELGGLGDKHALAGECVVHGSAR
jgi:hypothetical protein